MTLVIAVTAILVSWAHRLTVEREANVFVALFRERDIHAPAVPDIRSGDALRPTPRAQ